MNKLYKTLHQKKKNQEEIVNVIKHEVSKTPTVKISLILSAVYQIPDVTKSTEKTVQVSNFFSFNFLLLVIFNYFIFRMKKEIVSQFPRKNLMKRIIQPLIQINSKICQSMIEIFLL